MGQFGQITHTQTYVVPFHTKKLFTTLQVNSPSFSGRIVPFFDVMLVSQGEGSGTPTEPHHTPSPQYTRRARIAQSSALPPIADEPASPVRDVSQGEACPTDSGFITDQDRVTIAKSSTLPHDSAPRVTSPVADEGSMQLNIIELTILCTSLQRQHSDLLAKFQAQDVEILKLKERVKVLEDREGIAATRSGDDAPIKGRSMDEGEVATERISDDTKEVAAVLTSIDAVTVLAGGIDDVPTGSGSIPTAGPLVVDIPTGSDVGEGSGTPTEPHHTPSFVAQTPSHTTQPTSLLPPISTTSIPTVTPTETTPIQQYTRRARIAQSSPLLPVADDPASPVRDVSQGEACLTDSGFIADQDRATIAKSSTSPHDSAPRVTSPVADEGSMQPNITELTVLCTSLQRQHSELLAKFQAQEVEILKLKERVNVLEDREGIAATRSGDDAPIKGRGMDEGEAATERISDDTEKMATVLTSIDAATVLARGIDDVPSGSGSIPTAGPPVADIPSGSEVIPTASLVFATATVVTPYSRRKGKEVMVESDTPKKQRL
nr:hypothetical protein [Tanacetum cinerariifolium]